MKKKKRDMQASAKTLAYFLQTRAGKPTSVQQAARALRVPSSRVTNMASRFHKEGHILRLSRGVYASLPAQAAQPLNLDQFLEELKKERADLDAHIERVEHVIELRKTRGLK